VSSARELLGRYLRQRSDLGETELLLERLRTAQINDLVTSRMVPTGPRPTEPYQMMAAVATAPAMSHATVRAPRISLSDATLDETAVAALSCTNCELCETRAQAVFGEGNVRADVMVVGEAPGAEEDRTGRPFVGRGGRLLDRFLASAGFPRETVYICNVLKCRPPGNRNPTPEEIEACNPFLVRQIELVAPRAILAAGAFAANTLLGTSEPIGRLRGRVHDHKGIPLVPTYHPAAVLRNPGWIRPVWDDLQRLRGLIDNA
jgi:DNA polymerase